MSSPTSRIAEIQARLKAEKAAKGAKNLIVKEERAKVRAELGIESKGPGRPRKDNGVQMPTRTIVEDGALRDVHPYKETIALRVNYITELLARGAWKPECTKQLSTDWKCSQAAVRNVQAEAQRRLEAGNIKELVQQFVRERCMTWMSENRAGDRIKAAELLLKTHGALVDKQEITHSMASMSDEQVQERAISELLRDPTAREKIRAALAAYEHDPLQLSAGAVEVLEERTNDE